MSVTEQAFSRRFPARPSDPVHEVHDVHETTDPDPVQELAEMADLLGVDATALDTAVYGKVLKKLRDAMGFSKNKEKEDKIARLREEIQDHEDKITGLETTLHELQGKAPL